MQDQHLETPPSVNFHINSACNANCGFCFARFDDVEEAICGSTLRSEPQLEIVRRLAEHFDKITFAGGEPTLVPWLPRLVAEAKRQGMTTMLVTNGSRLDRKLVGRLSPCLDWLALSVDSADPETNRMSGRAVKAGPIEAARLIDVARRARASGVRIKVNTVVHRLNAEEDLRPFIRAVAPERWKLMQVMRVEDQNGDDFARFEIDRDAYEAFAARHRSLEDEGIRVIVESNDLMRGSYAMVDPAGRFFDSSDGNHFYSQPILDVGVRTAFSQVSFDHERFERREGYYDWEAPSDARFVCLTGVSGSGKDTAARFLVENAGYSRIAIADPIKEVVGDLFALTEEQLWGEQRNARLDRIDRSPRKLLQQFGSFCTNVDSDVWMRRWMRSVNALVEEGKRVVTTDVRTRAEFEMARRSGAVLIRISRPGAGAPGDLSGHAHESALARLPDSSFDHVLKNDGTLEQLRREILRVVRDV